MEFQKKLFGTVFPFNYGDLDKLKYLVKNKNIAAIKMEVGRSRLPDITFLKKVSNLAKKNKVLLIFDECTSGFRRNLGGLHLTTGVNPDIAMFGKAIGNGYAITAVLGKKNVMKKASNSFISSTFWTERIGFVAAISTLEYMEKHQTWKKLIKNGMYLNAKWKEISKKYNLPIEISGIDSITQFSFQSKRNQEYKTLITQEMLKNNILATNLVFLNVFHTKKIIDKYIIELDKVFKIIKKIEDGDNIKKYLKSKVSDNHFQRLTN
jgi:glutamate-1-semialdehyde 2,1-aminomutase